VWEAQYKSPILNEPPVRIEGTAVNECPVSYCTAESVELVQLFHRASTLKEVIGTPGYGPDFEIPSRMADAFVILHDQSKVVENALRRSANRSMEHQRNVHRFGKTGN